MCPSSSDLTLISHTGRMRRLPESDERDRLQKTWVRIEGVETHKMVLDERLELVQSNGDGALAIALVLLPLRSCSQRTSRDCR